MTITVHTGEEFVAAIRNAADSPITVIRIDSPTGEITLPSPAIYPKKLKAKGKQLLIIGDGHVVNAGARMPFVIGREQPVTSDEANNVMQSQTFSVENLTIDGKSLADVGLLHRCTYHDQVSGVKALSTLQDGIIMEFCMNAILSQCETRNINRIGIGLMSGTYPGAGFNKSGSNNSKAISCRSFPKSGQFAAFAAANSGRVKFEDCLVDHHNGNAPLYGFDINNISSTTAKNVDITGLWAESEIQSGGALIRANLNGGVMNVSGVYSQKVCTLMEIVGGGYAVVNLKDQAWVPAGCKFSSVANGILWQFDDPATAFNFTDPANWIGGVVPTKISVNGFITPSKGQGMNGSHLQLNGSRVVTETMLNTTLANYVKKA